MRLYLNGPHTIDFAATASNGEWLFSIGPTGSPNTLEIQDRGDYAWRILGTLSGVTYALGSGTVTVFANPAGAPGQDRRSHAQRMVPLLEAEIEARITGDGSAHNSYVLGQRQIEKVPLEELTQMLGLYESRARGNRLKPLKVHFGVTG